jgi:hypothetical protein
MKGKLKLTKDHPPSPSKEGKRGFNFNFIIIILRRLLKKKKGNRKRKGSPSTIYQTRVLIFTRLAFINSSGELFNIK